MKIDTEKVKKILVDELDYKEFEAEHFLKDFPNINEELVPAVEQWLKDRTIVDTDFGGITIKDVMKTRCHFLMAINQLNRLFDDDLSDEKKKRLKELLKKPRIHW